MVCRFFLFWVFFIYRHDVFGAFRGIRVFLFFHVWQALVWLTSFLFKIRVFFGTRAVQRWVLLGQQVPFRHLPWRRTFSFGLYKKKTIKRG